ncbi:MAG: hypothetical protein QW549_01790 [Candidatus Micrarchaeaceae archaeon]
MLGAMLVIAANLLALVSIAYAFRGAKELAKLAAVALLGAALFYFEAMPILALIPGILIFCALVWAFGKRGWLLLALLAISYVIAFGSLGPAAVSLAMSLGVFSGALSMRGAKKRGSDSVEIRRDLFQIASGIAMTALFVAIGIFYAEWATIAIIIIGYMLVNYSINGGGSALRKYINSLEREGVQLGRGAVWLSAGMLLAFGFLANFNYVMLAIFAIFFADPIATIFGVISKRKVRLPYNKNKTVNGMVAFFITLSILGYLVVGNYALVVSLVCALVESAPIRIDDNFSVPVALIIMIKILALY